MKSFNYYKNKLKKESINQDKINSLKKESIKRLNFAEDILKKYPDYALENAFESIREMLDTKLFSQGLKSYSHEATISYLSELNFSHNEITRIDRLRQLRNNKKYYGLNIDKEDAEEAIILANLIKKRIL